MKSEQQPIYRVLHTVVLSSDRQIYLPGAIVDLSHLSPEARRQFVAKGLFETADGEPANIPANEPLPCKNCP